MSAKVTDYPAPAVLKPATSTPPISPTGARDVAVEGHIWGELSDTFSVAKKHAFDRVFVADCLRISWPGF